MNISVTNILYSRGVRNSDVPLYMHFNESHNVHIGSAEHERFFSFPRNSFWPVSFSTSLYNPRLPFSNGRTKGHFYLPSPLKTKISILYLNEGCLLQYSVLPKWTFHLRYPMRGFARILPSGWTHLLLSAYCVATKGKVLPLGFNPGSRTTKTDKFRTVLHSMPAARKHTSQLGGGYNT